MEILCERTPSNNRYLELETDVGLKSRMRENCTYGSVRGSRQAFHVEFMKGVSRLSTRRNIMVRATLAFAFLIGIVLLQIFLSRTERKWPGLILPIISFLFGFLYPFNMSAGAPIWQVFFVWLLGNIPTIIFLAIYFACRPKRKQTAGK